MEPFEEPKRIPEILDRAQITFDLCETAERLFYAEGIHAVGIDRIIAEKDQHEHEENLRRLLLGIAEDVRVVLVVLAALAATVAWIIWGVVEAGYYLPEIATQFVVLGIVSGVLGRVFRLNGMTGNTAAAAFREGAQALVPAALIIGAIMLIALNADVVKGFSKLFTGAFGSGSALIETALKATPLLFVGVGITIAFRANVINIGGEGQMILGARGRQPGPAWMPMGGRFEPQAAQGAWADRLGRWVPVAPRSSPTPHPSHTITAWPSGAMPTDAFCCQPPVCLIRRLAKVRRASSNSGLPSP